MKNELDSNNTLPLRGRDGVGVPDNSALSPNTVNPPPTPLPQGGEEAVRAFVVFTGQTDWPWLRLLKPGYRHCFVLIHDGERWLSMDPMLNHTEIQVHKVPRDFDMAGWLINSGHHVIGATICRDHKKPAPFMLFTCVEAVKRVLGLHDWRIITPWQLYRALTAPSHNQGHYFFKGELSWEA